LPVLLGRGSAASRLRPEWGRPDCRRRGVRACKHLERSDLLHHALIAPLSKFHECRRRRAWGFRANVLGARHLQTAPSIGTPKSSSSSPILLNRLLHARRSTSRACRRRMDDSTLLSRTFVSSAASSWEFKLSLLPHHGAAAALPRTVGTPVSSWACAADCPWPGNLELVQAATGMSPLPPRVVRQGPDELPRKMTLERLTPARRLPSSFFSIGQCWSTPKSTEREFDAHRSVQRNCAIAKLGRPYNLEPREPAPSSSNPDARRRRATTFGPLPRYLRIGV